MLQLRSRLRIVAAVLALGGASALAQGYPSKPIRLVVGFPPGGGVDINARLLAPKLTELLGQPVIVENRPGANGLIAAREAVKAPPDGHTMFLALINNAIGDVLKPDPCCRLNQELLPVSRFSMTPLVMVVTPSLPASSLKEFLNLAKTKELTYATAGPGSSSHLVGEWIKSETGIQMLEVPYKGFNAEIPDLIGGQVTVAFVVPQVVVAPIKAGRL
ncbi:MAG: Bug family tripartite tricarboxylate transporter substrate binding protein, partial [Pseudomonadota bacterium]